MSIIKNPEYNSFALVLIVAIFIGVGYLVYQTAGTPENFQEGRVIQTTKKKNTDMSMYARESCRPPVTMGMYVGDSCSVADSSCNGISGSTQMCTGDSGNVFPCCCLSLSGGSGCWNEGGIPSTPVSSNTGTPVEVNLPASRN